jgi:exosortase/archaeosortase family protein
MGELPFSSGFVFPADSFPDNGFEPMAHSRSPLVLIAVFLGLFAVMQLGWSSVRNTWVERLVIDEMTVKPAAWLISRITPDVPIQASGTHLSAPGGGINILNGCDGMEEVFLLVAAMLIAPIPARWRFLGALAGGGLIFIGNQARILALFYSYRADKSLFGLLHGIVAPILLILVASGFYVLWLGRYRGAPVSGKAS